MASLISYKQLVEREPELRSPIQLFTLANLGFLAVLFLMKGRRLVCRRPWWRHRRGTGRQMRWDSRAVTASESQKGV